MNINLILLASSNFFDDLACKQENCLSFIIVFLNILAVFYLVFCSYCKQNKITRCFGWIYNTLLISLTITIIAFDTCLYTLLCSVFTVLISLAMISEMVNIKEKSQTEKIIKGSYLIGQFSNLYSFSLYDKNKKLLAISPLRLSTYDECVDAINEIRENGANALKEDRTSNWIQKRQQPKFILEKIGLKYKFTLVSTKGQVILESELFYKYAKCNKTLNIVQKSVMTPDIYVLSNVVFSDVENTEENNITIDEK